MNETPRVRTEQDDAPLAAAVTRLRAARTVDDDVRMTGLRVDDDVRMTGLTIDDDVPVRRLAVHDEVQVPALTGDAGSATAALDVVQVPRRTVDAGSATAAVDVVQSVPRGDAVGEPVAAADALRERVADRREATAAARKAAAAYAALHGHVAGGDEDELEGTSGTRWALRPRTAIVATCAVLVLAAGAAAAAAWPRGHVEELAPVRTVASVAAPSPVPAPEPTPSALVVVDVVGQVHSPGLVTLPAGSRVFDAVAAAGGASEGAELGAVNLARPVVDGEQLRVPAPGEAVTAVADPAAAPAGPGGGNGGGTGAGGLIDLNTADEATLDTLPGIGPALAARIVAWRTDNGPFASVDELDEVSGIGPAMLAKVRDLVTV